MKKLIYLSVGLLLSLSAALFMGCEKKPLDEPATGGDYVETAFGMELQMVAVEGGTFMMGATPEQGDDYSDWAKPAHNVTVDGFYIGKFEVTQAQWEAVMGTTIEEECNEASAQNGDSHGLYGVGDAYPMYYVCWDDAQVFCAKLSERTGKTYRLPTEAEWEYAARGGNRADSTKYAGSNNIDDVAWYDTNSNGQAYLVGQKLPNGLGLYDMSGNVWEWCQDWYGSYSRKSVVNPQGPSTGDYRVLRGGDWSNNARESRVSQRYLNPPDLKYYFLGFRIACER